MDENFVRKLVVFALQGPNLLSEEIAIWIKVCSDKITGLAPSRKFGPKQTKAATTARTVERRSGGAAEYVTMTSHPSLRSAVKFVEKVLNISIDLTR